MDKRITALSALPLQISCCLSVRPCFFNIPRCVTLALCFSTSPAVCQWPSAFQCRLLFASGSLVPLSLTFCLWLFPSRSMITRCLSLDDNSLFVCGCLLVGVSRCLPVLLYSSVSLVFLCLSPSYLERRYALLSTLCHFASFFLSTSPLTLFTNSFCLSHCACVPLRPLETVISIVRRILFSLSYSLVDTSKNRG